MTLRWFLSGQVREATEAHKHVRRMLNAQRDLLTPEAQDALQSSLAETRRVIDSDADKATIKKQLEELEKTANKHLKPTFREGWTL